MSYNPGFTELGKSIKMIWSIWVRPSHHQQPCPGSPCPRPLFTCPCYPPSAASFTTSFSLLWRTPQSWITLHLEPVWRDSICDSYTDHQSLLIHVMNIFWMCGPGSSLAIQQEVVCPSKVSQSSRKASLKGLISTKKWKMFSRTFSKANLWLFIGWDLNDSFRVNAMHISSDYVPGPILGTGHRAVNRQNALTS